MDFIKKKVKYLWILNLHKFLPVFPHGKFIALDWHGLDATKIDL